MSNPTSDNLIEASISIAKIRYSMWQFGVICWFFGIADRTVAIFNDSDLSAIELSQLFTAIFLFVSWLCLKPEVVLGSVRTGFGQIQQKLQGSPNFSDYENQLTKAQARMIELEPQHAISQEYTLPFPYLCQIYHLLNLKHLENVHSFSLSNLRVLKVSQVQPTNVGGKIKFQTVLSSEFNALRIWRQPIVEVELILHTPFTVELNIPVYQDKRIIVMFNVLPLSNVEHKLFIDIYSDINFPKPLLQVLLHFASCLTLFEDLPYLRTLSKRNSDRLIATNSNHETMWLFNRFVDLYGRPTSQPLLTSNE